jgi:hypothetical protein
MMASLKGRGAMPVVTVKTEGAGETLDLGDVELVPAYKVAGRLKLSDGKAVPKDTAVYLTTDLGNDQQVVKVDGEGRFGFADVPGGAVTIEIQVLGYRVSAENVSFEAFFGSRLLGLVEQDIAGMCVLMEPGKVQRDVNGQQDALKRTPLQGVAGN